MRQVLLVVDGMTCGACIGAIKKNVGALVGVKQCDVSLVTNECIVLYNENGTNTNADTIKECVKNCGFDSEFISDDSIAVYMNGVLTVQGMTCSACTSAIKEQVLKMGGIEAAEVSLVTEECLVVFDSSLANIEDIKETIDDCGFGAQVISVAEITGLSNKGAYKKFKTTNFKLRGLSETCDVQALTNYFQDVDNAGQISNISITDGTVDIEYDQEKVGIRGVVRALEALGYGVFIKSNLDRSAQLELLSKVREILFWNTTFICSAVISVIIMSMYMFVPLISSKLVTEHHFPYNQTYVPGLYYRDIIGFIFTTYVQFYTGSYFYKAAWSSFKHRSGTMDTLVCISTSCAYFFSIYSIFHNIFDSTSHDMLPNVIFSTSSILIAFISLGKYLENKAKSQTSTALSQLISLTPSYCDIIEDDNYHNPVTIPTEYLHPGDIVEVRAGVKIPADGLITKGQTEIDESLMTGESTLVTKMEGDLVIGGTVNGTGHFYFLTTDVGEDTRLSNIIKTVKQAQLTKAPIQRYSDYLASIFVPIILILALITFFFWSIICRTLENLPSAFTEGVHGKFYICFQTAISVVVVACPCALGLAAPTAIMVGTGVGAQNGILIKGGDKLELFNEIKTFIFDKTGTLTTGCMSVKCFTQESGISLSEEILVVIRISTATSEHPVSKAIKTYTETLEADSEKYETQLLDHKDIIGKGLESTCMVNGTKFEVVVGNKHLMPSDWKASSNESNEHLSRSYVSINGKVLGKFEIEDDIRSDSYETIQYLKNRGYACYMVTGDTHNSALKVAQEVGLDFNNIYSEVTPDGKCEIVEKLKKELSGKVAFIGDGINDTPALVSSDLGISISSGTDIAMEAADIIVLTEGDSKKSTLKRVIYAMDISQATFKRIKLNLFWALFYNTFMIPIAMGILIPWGVTLHPMAAALAMAMSSVSVILSSLALKSWEPIDLTIDLENYNSSKGDGISSWFKPFHFAKPSSSSQDIELQANLIDRGESSNYSDIHN